MIEIEEENRSERAVSLYLSHHPSYAVAVIRVVLGMEAYAIIAYGEKSLARLFRRHIPPHPLMHHSL